MFKGLSAFALTPMDERGIDMPALAQLVQRLQQQLRSGGYTYTLDPGVYTGQAADEFWFDRKQGFCEHISAAFVIAPRRAGPFAPATISRTWPPTPTAPGTRTCSTAAAR